MTRGLQSGLGPRFVVIWLTCHRIQTGPWHDLCVSTSHLVHLLMSKWLTHSRTVHQKHFLVLLYLTFDFKYMLFLVIIIKHAELIFNILFSKSFANRDMAGIWVVVPTAQRYLTLLWIPAALHACASPVVVTDCLEYYYLWTDYKFFDVRDVFYKSCIPLSEKHDSPCTVNCRQSHRPASRDTTWAG